MNSGSDLKYVDTLNVGRTVQSFTQMQLTFLNSSKLHHNWVKQENPAHWMYLNILCNVSGAHRHIANTPQ